MKNNKLEKVNAEIISVQSKINELADKVKKLEIQKIELENLEIIAAFRKSKISLTDLPKILNKINYENNSKVEEKSNV